MEAIIKNIRGYVTERRIKLAVRIILGGVFIIAGIAKLFDHRLLSAQLKDIFPLNIVGFEASTYALIAFEIVLGALIIFKLKPSVLYTTIGTLIIFIGYLSYKIYNHDPSTCGCFGNFVYVSNKQELLNNLVLLMGSVYIIN